MAKGNYRDRKEKKKPKKPARPEDHSGGDKKK